jgi:SAM-dependent methyltransferase
MTSSSDVNRAYWDSWSDEYQQRHGAQLNVDEPVWGSWSIPEAELGVLGDVAGKDVLELGCGAAQWSIQLAKRGARVVGLDNSERQLEHARRLMEDAGVEFPLVHAAAESVPLDDESFDVFLSDHGGLSWADPFLVVAEVARLLRPGGLLAFNITSPFAWVCFNEEADTLEPRLHVTYFGMHREDTPEGNVQFNLQYGEWIRLFLRSGLRVEALVEPRPAEGATTTYDYPLEWARRWPKEALWKVRKCG